MPKRQRIDSVSAQIEVAQRAAVADLSPPAHVRLGDEALPFFRSVLAEFARSEWTAHQLELAAFLARDMYHEDREQQLFASEGGVIANSKGDPVQNPRLGVVSNLANVINSRRRTLSLHARAQHGDTRDIAKRRAATKEVEESFDDDDDLLA